MKCSDVSCDVAAFRGEAGQLGHVADIQSVASSDASSLDCNGRQSEHSRTRLSRNSDEAPFRVGLIDSLRFSRECFQRALIFVHPNVGLQIYASVEGFMKDVSTDIELLIYHSHATRSSAHQLLHEVAPLQNAFKKIPVIVMSSADDGFSAEDICEIMHNGIRGFILTRTTGVDVAMEAIRLVRIGGIFVPFDEFLIARKGMTQQSLNESKAVRLEETSLLGLTVRQAAVLSHMKQGKANKIIAHELCMSESTVKVHVRNIMRRLGATNRTQAVFRAQASMVHGSGK